MNKKLVSIIVPIYNVEKYIEECINSIISQTYKELEIILVNDGSPDNSGKICDQYAQKDNRIKVIHKNNGGLSSARNAGIVEATGEYITFCDSDDVILPQTISRYIEIQQKYNCDVVSCESLLFKNGVTTNIEHYHKTDSITFFTGEEYIGGFFNYSTDCSVCNKLYKKEIIGGNLFEEGKTNEDILFQYEILKNKKIVHTNEGLYLYRINEEGITHTFNQNSTHVYCNAITIYNKIKKEIPSLEKDAFDYKIWRGYNLAMKILKSKKDTIEPFKSILLKIRTTLLKELYRITIKSNYSITQKLKIIYLILGAPGLFLGKEL